MKKVAESLLSISISVTSVFIFSGCVSLDSAPAAKTQVAEDPFIQACDSFHEYTALFLEDDVNFELRAARAQIAADDFALLVSEHPEAAGYVETLRSVVRNQGQYADDLNAYTDLLNFCKKHSSK